MGQDTKLLVKTDSKDVRDILLRVQKVITGIVGKNPKAKGILRNGNPNFMPDFNYNPRYGFATVNFFHGTDARKMFVHFTCDGDYTDVCDKKILLSLGAWGGSVEIMHLMRDALSSLGPVYIVENDCANNQWRRIG